MSDLDDLLSDEPNEEVISDAEEETVEEETNETPEEPTEPEDVKAETPEPEEDPRDKEIAGLKAALAAAREKARGAKEQPPQVDPPQFADPQGAQFFQQQLMMLEADRRADNSELKARMSYDKVDEAFEAAEQLGIVDRFKGTADPWGELVKWHKDFEDTRKAKEILSQTGGDLSAYETQMREKIRKELEAEMVAEKVSAKAPSLAGETNLGQRQGNGAAWSGPTPLDDILGG